MMRTPYTIRKYELLLTLLWLAPLFWFTWFVTIDGPAHMAMSKLILQGMFHDCRGENLLQTNPVTTNLGAQYLLALLIELFPDNIAEKVLIALYIFIFVYGCRYLLISINPKTCFPILPGLALSYNGMLLNGLYNFVISFALLLWALGYWNRHKDNMHVRKQLLMLSLLCIMHFFHVYGFYLFLLAVMLLSLFDLYLGPVNKQVVGKRLKKLFQICLPVILVTTIAILFTEKPNEAADSLAISFRSEHLIRVMTAPLGMLTFFSDSWSYLSKIALLLLIAAALDISVKTELNRRKWLCFGVVMTLLSPVIPEIGKGGINFFITDRVFWSGLVFISLALSLPMECMPGTKLRIIRTMETIIAAIYIIFSVTALFNGLRVMQKYEDAACRNASRNTNAYFIDIKAAEENSIVENFINNRHLRAMGEPAACNLPLTLYQLTEPSFPINIKQKYGLKTANWVNYTYEDWQKWADRTGIRIDVIYIWQKDSTKAGNPLMVPSQRP